MTECALCGDCCDVLMLAYSQEEARISPTLEPANREWVVTALRPISREEAEAIKQCSLPERGHYFQCAHFNYETRRCEAYEKRPPICQGFPWYGGQPNPFPLHFFRRCSYWNDVPQSEWPSDVIPLTPGGSNESG